MSRIARALTCITLMLMALSLDACATSKGYDRICKTWLDKDANQLMRSCGPPVTVQEMPNGNRLLFYKRSATGYYHSPYYSMSIPVTSWCETWFETTPDGKIIRYKWQGNACKAKYL